MGERRSRESTDERGPVPDQFPADHRGRDSGSGVVPTRIRISSSHVFKQFPRKWIITALGRRVVLELGGRDTLQTFETRVYRGREE